MSDRTYKFEILPSILNHLGRNLYRGFITVLGEAISNSWDADAKNVWIEIENNNLTIKDDGMGMNEYDFESKFLRIGYSKRGPRSGQKPVMNSPSGRPFIGSKGIGKLALLSCADTISIISKTLTTDYVSGVIDNHKLDKIVEDNGSSGYLLESVDQRFFIQSAKDLNSGTVIHCGNVRKGMKGAIPRLRKMIALYFRFALIDNDFKIHLNGTQVTQRDLKELSMATEFLWNINDFEDPYIGTLSRLKGNPIEIRSKIDIKGFIATVAKPKDLKVVGTEERVGLDLFVNGRLREKDILKRIPTARIVESYIYGQIHYDALDSDGEDRFTSSREGVIESDEKYQSLLETLRSIMPSIFMKWDMLRLSNNEEGDDENVKFKTKKQRRARSLYDLSVKELRLDKRSKGWIEDLIEDAEFNIPAYAECFLSENLLRRYIAEKQIDYSKFSDAIKKYRDREVKSKSGGNVNISIRKRDDDLDYLGMYELTKIIDNPGGIVNTMVTDGKEYMPIRNAVAHTALLTDQAKRKLTTIYENVRARVSNLMSRSA